MRRAVIIGGWILLALACAGEPPPGMELDVRVAPDRGFHAPGDRVTMTVHEVGPDGALGGAVEARWTVELPDGSRSEPPVGPAIELELEQLGWTVATACVGEVCERGGVLVTSSGGELVVEAPRPGQVFESGEEILVRGRLADAGVARVFVNDWEAPLDEAGRFEVRLDGDDPGEWPGWDSQPDGYRHVVVTATDGYESARWEMDVLRAPFRPVRYEAGAAVTEVDQAYRVGFDGVLRSWPPDDASPTERSVAELVASAIRCTRIVARPVSDSLTIESARVTPELVRLLGATRFDLEVEASVRTTLGGEESGGTLTWTGSVEQGGVAGFEGEDDETPGRRPVRVGSVSVEGTLEARFDSDAAQRAFDEDADLADATAALVSELAVEASAEAMNDVWGALERSLAEPRVAAGAFSVEPVLARWHAYESWFVITPEVRGAREAVRRGVGVPVLWSEPYYDHYYRGYGLRVDPALAQALSYLAWADGSLDVELADARFRAPLPPVLEREGSYDRETGRPLATYTLSVGAWEVRLDVEGSERAFGARVDQPLVRVETAEATGLAFDGEPAIDVWGRDGAAVEPGVEARVRARMAEAWSTLAPTLERHLLAPFPHPSVEALAARCPAAGFPSEIELTDRFAFPDSLGFEAYWR